MFCFYYFGGAFGLSFLLGTFFTIFFVSLIRKKLRPDLKKEKSRNALQILINGGLGTVFIILYGVCRNDGFLLVSVVAVGGCFVDSLSSDVGVLSRKRPYDFLKRSFVDGGLSGGMSVLGTAAALVGSAVIGLCTAARLSLGVSGVLAVAGLIFLQTLVDSALGSAVQVKYRCTVCGRICEKKRHCDTDTEYHSGWRVIDNNGVNALSSVIITALAYLVFG